MRRTARHVAVDFAELSHPGLDPAKQVNEDASAFRSGDAGHLAVVCDGMGGHTGGREASQLAVRTIIDRFEEASATESSITLLRSAIEAANLAVHRMGGDAPTESRPGATCVAAIVAEPGVLVAHVGDSRALLIRGDGVYPLTRDHSMVQQLVDAGVIAPHEAADHPDANRITRALGMAPHVQVEVASTWQPLRVDDVLLLTTDGVTDLVEPHELRDIVRDRIPLGPAVVCEQTVRRANARGGHDNSTIQVVHILEIPQRAERPTLDEPTAPGGDGYQTRVIGTTRWSQAPGTGPTVVDAGPDEDGARATEPDLAPPSAPLHSGGHPRPPPTPTPVPPPLGSPASPLRAGLFVAFGVALLVAMTAALALFVRFMRSKGDEAPAPIEITSAPTERVPEHTELVADPDPPPAPTPALDPSAAPPSALPPSNSAPASEPSVPPAPAP